MPPLRIAILHGFMDSAEKRMRQCKTLRQRMNNVEFVSCESPLLLSKDEVQRVASTEDDRVVASTMHKWWSLSRDDIFSSTHYDTLHPSMDFVCAWLHTNGPFDGIMGFSQGAVLSACLLLRDNGALPATIRFGILVGGFPITDAAFLATTQDTTTIPRATLHVAGRGDTFVSPERSEQLRRMFCAQTQPPPPPLLMHNGGHYVPSDSAFRAELQAFLARFVS